MEMNMYLFLIIGFFPMIIVVILECYKLYMDPYDIQFLIGDVMLVTHQIGSDFYVMRADNRYYFLRSFDPLYTDNKVLVKSCNHEILAVGMAVRVVTIQGHCLLVEKA